MITSSHIIFINETWLADWENDIADDFLELDFETDFHNPQMKNHKEGRPFGGMGWIYMTELKQYIQIKHISNNITACIVNLSKQLVIIGCYMPTNDYDNYKNECNILSNLIKEYQNNDIILIGDFNASIERTKNTSNSNNRITRLSNTIRYTRYPADRIFKNWLDENKLSITSKLYTQPTFNTYFNGGKESTIDHIIIYQHDKWKYDTQINIICRCQCKRECWEAHNLSDHRAIKINFKTSIKLVHQGKTETEHAKTTKINWEPDWTKQRYHMLVEDIMHKSNYYKTLNIAKIENSTSTAQAITDHLNSSLLWAKNKIYIKRRFISKPKDNLPKSITNTINAKNSYNNKLYNDKISTIKSYYRAEQRRQIRRLNCEKRFKRIQNINDKFNQMNNNNFWKEINHQKGGKPKSVEINTEQLETYYKKSMNEAIMNSTIYDNEVLAENIKCQLTQIKDTIGKINIDKNVINSIIDNKLKYKKASGFSQLENECYIYAPRPTIIDTIIVLFDLIINRNIIPTYINVGVLCPIIKNEKEDASDINNVRPITLSETIAIILEYYLLETLQNNIQISDLQFGFKKNNSTQHAIFILKELILQHQMDKKPLYICFLDFSKAFDKINKLILTQKLLDIVNIYIVQAIFNYMMHAKIQIKNNNSKSSIFSVDRGVKQGGPASPFLFAWYIDNMIKEVVQLGAIACLYAIKIGMLCYADDTTVASNNLNDLTSSTSCISNYCQQNEIKINETKTKWIKIGNKSKQEGELIINNKVIEKVDRFKFLGFELTSNMKYYEHVSHRINKSRNVTYALNKLGINSFKLKPNIKTFLYKAYARSILTYGFENVYFNGKLLKEVTTYESLTIKRLLHLPKYCSTSKLYLAIGLTPIDIVIKKQKLRFIARLYNNELTRQVLEDQCLRINSLHKQSLITEIIELYLSKPTILINNLDTLMLATKEELGRINRREIVTDEIKNIKFLLENRSKYNNETLINLLLKCG